MLPFYVHRSFFQTLWLFFIFSSLYKAYQSTRAMLFTLKQRGCNCCCQRLWSDLTAWQDVGRQCRSLWLPLGQSFGRHLIHLGHPKPASNKDLGEWGDGGWMYKRLRKAKRWRWGKGQRGKGLRINAVRKGQEKVKQRATESALKEEFKKMYWSEWRWLLCRNVRGSGEKWRKRP